MKTNIYVAMLFVALFTTVSSAAPKKYFYYGPDGKTYLDISKEKILIRFNDGVDFSKQASILAKESELQPLTEELLLPSPRVAVAHLKPGLTQEQIESLVSRLNGKADIRYANPFLVYSDGTLQGIQEKFLVKLNSTSQFALLQQQALKYHVTIEGEDTYVKNLYHLSATKASGANAMEIANKFAELGQFNYSEPDFLRIMKIATPNDPFLNSQWELSNTGSNTSQWGGTAGCDLNIFNAWTLSTGSSTVKIAIIDEGVSLTHADLAANLVPGYDAAGLGSNGGPNTSDAHGTNCAGIAAAVGNNGIGIAGIAYGCKIVPIRMGYESPAGSGQLNTSDSWISNSFNFAWQTAGADVISNSWGGGSSSTTINNAISSATTSGRGGKGAAVIFAAGNSNSSVQYPATLSNVISVAAMSMCNKRKSTSSCDGENWWGSSFGTNLDVAAPGVKIYATDLPGSNGYSSTDYYSSFNGTSSACPAVAGVMGLIYSVNPALSLTDARFDLESTCQKVGGYAYNSNVSGQPNGTWSSDLGYGRVDAYAAMLAAQGSTSGCGIPSGLSASSITTSSATLSWNSVSGATSYNIQYKPTTSGTWTSTSTGSSSLAVSGLAASTLYEFQVQTVCASSSSAFSGSATFTTQSTTSCTESFESNNTKTTAKAISLNTNILSQISTTTDVDWFSFTNSSAAKNIKITLTTLPADYDIELYKNNGSKVATSDNSDTNNEQIIYNSSTVGTFKVKIYGWNGAHSNTQCYTLFVTTSSSPFRLTDGETATENSMMVYPNPAAGNLNIAYTSLADGSIEINLYDLTGRLLQVQPGTAAAGTNTYQLSLNQFDPGVYLLQIKNGNDVTRSKFIIER